MNSFDLVIQSFFVRYSSKSIIVNSIIEMISKFYLFKGFSLILILWWIWFTPKVNLNKIREIIISTIISALIALIFGKIFSYIFPFKFRPIYNLDINFNFPITNTYKKILEIEYSSFPSDHAILWFSISTGIFLIFKWMGIISFLYTIFFICIPRIYLGLHYPTDIIAGALIGIFITYILINDMFRKYYANKILYFINTFPGYGYVIAFILSYELITQFDELLQISNLLKKILLI